MNTSTKTLLAIFWLSVLFQSNLFCQKGNEISDEISDCIADAAYKIAKTHNQEAINLEYAYKGNIEDLPNGQKKVSLSISWKDENVPKHSFWVNGSMTFRENCCDRRFRLLDYSSEIKSNKIPTQLDCQHQRGFTPPKSFTVRHSKND